MGCPSTGDLQNGLLIMDNPIKMDDLNRGTPISGNLHISGVSV